MDNPTILVADGDPKNLQILRESLEASGFEVIVASDGLQAWQKISSDVPDLILSEVNLPKLDGFQLLEKLKADPVTSSIPLMFLTNRRELQDRVRSLRGGVKDYMIKPLHVKEVIARVRMILRRMERIREEDVDTNRKLAGRLEEFSVIDLIENFGMERKTGILTLYNANNRSGEIYFRDGAVINASLGNLRAEKAVYQMLPWKRGHFAMTFKDLDVPDEIAVSNLGLLLQGFKRMEERERFFKMLPSPETTFVTTETFRNIIQKRELTTDVAKFIALIDGRRDILQVIDESTYDDIKTLERLVKLYQQGFIKPSKTSIAGDEEMNEMVSSIAEPKIMERYTLGPNRDQNFSGRLPGEKEMPMEPIPSSQALRPPSLAPYAPPERAFEPERKQDGTVISRDPEADFPSPPRQPVQNITAFPPPLEPAMPEEEGESMGDAPIYLEPYGEDAPPDEPPSYLAEESSEPVLPEPEDKNSPATPSAKSSEPDQVPQYVPPGFSTKDEQREPERLPIDLGALMQRPTAPPPALDQPVEPPAIIEQPEEPERLRPSGAVEPETPPAFEPPAIEAKVAEPVAVPPLAKLPEAKPSASAVEPASPSTDIIEDIIAPAQEEKTAASATPSAPISPAAPSTTSPQGIAPPIATPPVPQLGEVVSDCLTKLFKSRPVPKPKLVIIGREGIHVSPIVRHLLGPESSLRKLESTVFQYLEIGERKLPEAQPFELIGISMEQQFTRLLDTAGTDLIGCIVVVEAYRKDGIEYLSYLLNMLKSVYRRPLGIAVIKSAEHKNMASETLRDLLNIAPTDFVQECVPTDRLSVTGFLQGFTSEANLQRYG